MPRCRKASTVENNYLEKIMKNTMKTLLALSILCTAAFAGDQQNGGRNCDPNDPAACSCPQGETCFGGGSYGMGDLGETMLFVGEEGLNAAGAYGR